VSSNILAVHRSNSARALRQPLTAGCEAPAGPPPPEWLPDLLHRPIDCLTVGDNIIIPAPGGRILIHAIQLWNVAAQTLILSNGPTAAGSRLMRLTNFTATGGYILGLSKMTWFEVDAGRDFILNLSSATQVDGFIRYRVKAG
jgi:hypothetical protein